MQLRVVSADNHVMEPPGTFVDRVPNALKDRVPRFMPAGDGGEGWSWDGTPPASSPVPNTMGTGGMGWTWDMLPRGNWDGAAHLEDMQRDGIDAAVLYPGIAGRLYTYADQEAKLACFRAYNDWLLDEFCAADPSRLIGVCLIPTDDSPKDMLGEAERVLDKGARALYVPMFPKRPLLDPFYEPLWTLATDADVAVSLHNFGGAPTPIPPTAGLDPLTMRASTIVQSFFTGPIPLSNMVFAGVFARHPNLRFVAAEVNVGWVPYWTQQMHMTIERQYMKGGNWYPNLPTRYPEEYVGRNIFFTVLDDRLGFRLLKDDPRLASATMWSIDYPHAVSLWGQTQELIAELTDGLDPTTRHAILAGTAMRVFKLV
ncbi:MAG: amidohydrolase [Chloroflexi bacterium]|nr:amidohydrolase [Chloroflexota bacterium]